MYINLTEQIIIFAVLLLFMIIIGVIIYKNIDLSSTVDELINNIEILDSSTPKLDTDDRITYTEHLLSFIDNMIELEVINEKRFELILGQNDKNLNIDKVLENVSTKVYNSIEKNIFTDPNNIVTSSYLMDYIQKKTFITCMSYVQNTVNNQIDE